MGLNVLKYIQMHIPKKGQQIVKQGTKIKKNGGKLPIIAKFQKLLNMVNK